jgi:hypothetical protein
LAVALLRANSDAGYRVGHRKTVHFSESSRYRLALGIGAGQVVRLNNLLFLMRFEDEPFPLRLTGKIQDWRRDEKGIMRIREEALTPEQLVLEPRPACPPQP